MISGDQSPPPAVLRRALAEREAQIQFVPSGGGRWIAMNTTIPPFDNVDVRRAVVAGFDREAMRLTFGGKVSGDVPTHFLPPGLPGFDEAGGLEGPGLDFMSRPRGDPALSAEYFRRAGYPSGRYEGDETFLMVGENVRRRRQRGAGRRGAVREAGLRRPAAPAQHRHDVRPVCSVPSAAVAICPSVGWQRDFADPQTFLAPTFSGDAHPRERDRQLVPARRPRAQRADAARGARSPTRAERAQAWADIDEGITRLAPAIPWIWPKQANIRSENVVGTIDEATALWSLAHTRLR